MTKPNGDGWLSKRARTILLVCGAFSAFVMALGTGVAITVKAADKVLFYHRLPNTIAHMRSDMGILLDVVCAAHPHPKCEDRIDD